MKLFSYAAEPAADILKELAVNSETGLEPEAVAKRRTEFGANSITLREVSAARIFLRQFRSAFVYLLAGAMAVTVALGEHVDSLMIGIFLAVNTSLGFFQEYRSEKIVKLLTKRTLPRVNVLRAGKIEQLTAESLVPGDIIMLATGDKIPADVRLLEQTGFMVDESILTGESTPVCKQAEVLAAVPADYQAARNLGFSGTDVLKGKAKAVVLATGAKTAFGQIAKLTAESRKTSDFEKGISRFATFIFKLVGLTIFIVFLANVFLKPDGVDVLELIIFSVALTVSVIPEALPLVTTFSLARGAKRLAKHDVIVKRLSAIEDLGGIEMLCSDKTGTLTENKLTVANIYAAAPEQTLLWANLAAAFELEKKTEPFDIALERELTPEQRERLKRAKKLAEEPFHPNLKRNVVLARLGTKTLLVTRGAPEAVLALCHDLRAPARAKIRHWVSREGRQGHRALAIAVREDTRVQAGGPTADNLLAAAHFSFAGIISFVDPIKPSAGTAVKKARELGVRMAVLTGDNPEVAGAVGCEIGLLTSPAQVVTGEQWERMDKKRQTQSLNDCAVFARVSPEQKFKIISALRERFLVGFLGEGINDAPALKIAGVSLVVDSAADIAREAADIVLLQKNLQVILDGIAEGRQVFANTTKYIKATLASNFGNFFSVATTSLMINFLPMLPIQILLVNLLTDTPMIVVSTDHVDRDELAMPKKYEVKDIIILAIVLGLVSTVFDFILFGMFYRISPAVLQTNWFIGSILTELALIYSIRTKSIFVKGSAPSRALGWLSAAVALMAIELPYTHFGQSVFMFTPPSALHLASILLIVIVYFFCSELVKLFYYRNLFRRQNTALVRR